MTPWSLADWSFEPGVLIGLTTMSAAYVIALRRLRPQTVWDEHVVAVREVAAFAGGVVLLIVALISPLDTLSATLFSAHMLQHMLLLYMVPPLLLVGLPAWALRPALRWPVVKRTLRFLTGPVPAIIIFNAVIVLWHMPFFWDAALVDPTVHGLEHICFLGAGLIAWWPIFSPLPEVPRLSYPAQMLYLFIQSLVPAIVGAFMTFSSIVIYPVYAETPKLWGMSPLVDQQIAGLLMKLLGTLFLWILVSIRFFQWFNHEEHEMEKAVDDLPAGRER
ncbi:MAG TPA: cytochrome c oxidase assembly protein [Chloroflexota bacterium]|nr:cytochrome c oxidase assembly protein [Chloroflexota bacterium]